MELWDRMVLTYKLKHNRDFTEELKKARQVAEFAVTHKFNSSSALVKHIGLKAAISAQILRKYGRNCNIKRVSNVNLIVPGQGVVYRDGAVCVPCLKLAIPFAKSYTKINQIELNDTYAFVSITVPEADLVVTKTTIGVDLNTTGHCAVVAVPSTGKVYKLGKKALHTHLKYKNYRKRAQLHGHYKLVKKIKHRESSIVRDLNHKISKFIVAKARENQAEIRLENLCGIRNRVKQARSFRYALNSWSFAQLDQFIEYKAKLVGIPVTKIDPAYTSQRCSRCGLLGTRSGKIFKCQACGHVENADANAAFNIANAPMAVLDGIKTGIGVKASNGKSQEALLLWAQQPRKAYA